MVVLEVSLPAKSEGLLSQSERSLAQLGDFQLGGSKWRFELTVACPLECSNFFPSWTVHFRISRPSTFTYGQGRFNDFEISFRHTKL